MRFFLFSGFVGFVLSELRLVGCGVGAKWVRGGLSVLVVAECEEED